MMKCCETDNNADRNSVIFKLVVFKFNFLRLAQISSLARVCKIYLEEYRPIILAIELIVYKMNNSACDAKEVAVFRNLFNVCIPFRCLVCYATEADSSVKDEALEYLLHLDDTESFCSLIRQINYTSLASPPIRPRPSLLVVACEKNNFKCVCALIAAGVYLHAHLLSSDHRPALMAAVSVGGYLCVTALLVARALPSCQDSQGFTPLMQAAMNGNLPIVSALLDAQCDPNVKANDGTTSLFCASRNGHTACVDALVNKGAVAELPNGEEFTSGATMIATCSDAGYAEVIDEALCVQLIGLKMRKAAFTIDEHTKASHAAGDEYAVNDCMSFRDIFALSKLLKTSRRIPFANLVFRVTQGCLATHAVVVEWFVALEWFLILDDMTSFQFVLSQMQYTCKPPDFSRLLVVASQRKTFQFVDQITSMQTSLYKKNCTKETDNHDSAWTPAIVSLNRQYRSCSPLMAATNEGAIDTVAGLIRARASSDVANCHGITPLMRAALRGHTDILCALLQEDADLNKKSFIRLLTPLMFASCGGHNDCVNVLLQSKANPDAQDHRGYTSLCIAVMNNHHACVESLLVGETSEKRANRHIASYTGVTPLTLAAFGGYNEIVVTLLKCGPAPNTFPHGAHCISDISHALVHAFDNNRISCVTSLIKEAPDSIRMLTLMKAIENSHVACVHAILTLYPSLVHLKEIDNYGTPLMCAVQRSTGSCVAELLAWKCNPNVMAETSALILACEHDRDDCVKLLIEAKCNVNDVDDHGDTALIMAVKQGRLQITNRLLNADADLKISDSEGNSVFTIAIAKGHRNICVALFEKMSCSKNFQ